MGRAYRRIAAPVSAWRTAVKRSNGHTQFDGTLRHQQALEPDAAAAAIDARTAHGGDLFDAAGPVVDDRSDDPVRHRLTVADDHGSVSGDRRVDLDRGTLVVVR